MQALANNRFARLTGTIVSVIAIAFFVYLISQTLEVGEAVGYFKAHTSSLLLAVMVYLIAWMPNSLSWIVVSRACDIPAKSTTLLNILYLSQAAKYLPGNVAQYIGRAVLAKRSGIALKPIGFAMGMELSAVLVACAVLSSIAFLTHAIGNDALPHQGMLGFVLKYAGVTMAGVALVCAVLVLRSGFDRLKGALQSFLLAVGLMIGTVLCFSFSNIAILEPLVPELDTITVLSIVAAVVVSWFAGFVTPGAPAGLGIREITFLALLSDTVPQDALILTTIMFRLTTVAGDLIMFVAGLLLRMSDADGSTENHLLDRHSTDPAQ